MASVVYTFVVRDAGDPTAGVGLTPTFIEYRDIATLVDLSASAPAVVEVGNGHYKFEVDWDTAPESTAPTDYISVVIDAGAGIVDKNERYITARINRNDDFATDVLSIDSRLTSIEAIVDLLQVADFFLRLCRADLDIGVGVANISIPFGDFVFEYQVVAKCIPG